MFDSIMYVVWEQWESVRAKIQKVGAKNRGNLIKAGDIYIYIYNIYIYIYIFLT